MKSQGHLACLDRCRTALLRAALPTLMVGLICQTGLVAQSLDQASASAPLPPPPGSVANKVRPARILVRPKAGVELSATHTRLKGRLHKRLAHVQCEVVEASEGRSARDLLESYRLDPDVEYAEEDVAYDLYWPSSPNDTYFSNRNAGLWGLYNETTGQWHINAPGGWGVRSNAQAVIVAVLDTGVRRTHADLQANMWENPGEVPGDGIDNDGNGYVDDTYGVDLYDNDTDPSDDCGHGTAIAGIIGARGNNALGMVGLAWQVKLMNVRVSCQTGPYLSALVQGIEYAISEGAQVLNISSGGPVRSQIYLDALSAARTAGVLVVCAAGNAHRNTDDVPDYPAGFELDNIVSVGGLPASLSEQNGYSYGQLSVDLMAPGKGILSTGCETNSNYVANLQGTSYAAPYVSGTLALLRAQYPGEDYLRLINRLFSGVAVDGRWDCQYRGKLSLSGALGATDYHPRNDSYDGRLEFPSVGSVMVPAVANNRDASKQPNEANHAGNSGGKSLWWHWQTPLIFPSGFNGKVVISTEGSDFDTLLAVYAGTGSMPTLGTTPVAQDDDSGPGGTSRLVLDVSTSTHYDIAVDGKNGASGQLKLWITPAPHTYLVRAANTLGYSPSYGTALADTMQVVGNSANSGGNLRAASWVSGVTTDLGTLGGAASEAYGVSETGVVVGRAQQANGYYRAFRRQSGTMSNLGTLGGTESEAKAVNNQGQIVGWSLNASAQHRAFVYDAGTMTALPTLGGAEGYAYAISDGGYIVGAAYTASGEQHACRWHNGVATDLLTLGGNSSCAFAINAYGLIAGTARNAAGLDRACIWDAGARIDLGTLGGSTAIAYGVNNLGQIVGTAALSSGAFRAFLWENGHMYDLNALLPAGSGWELREARAINENGEIAGWGVQAGVGNRAFLLTPNEPVGFRPTSAKLTFTPTSTNFTFDVRGRPLSWVDIQHGDALDPRVVSQDSVQVDLDANGLATYTESIPGGTTARYYRLASSYGELAAMHPAFVAIDSPEGYSMIANPLRTPDDRLCRLLSNAPDGASAYKWNEATAAYTTTVYEANYGGWGDRAMTLKPGEGVILRTLAGSGILRTWFVGGFVTSFQSVAIPASLAIRGGPLPIPGALSSELGFPRSTGDVVYLMNNGLNYTYSQYTFTNNAWSPSEPVVNVGESFWTRRSRLGEWWQAIDW